jgi:hypothetical protein
MFCFWSGPKELADREDSPLKSAQQDLFPSLLWERFLSITARTVAAPGELRVWTMGEKKINVFPGTVMSKSHRKEGGC